MLISIDGVLFGSWVFSFFLMMILDIGCGIGFLSLMCV